MLPSYSSKEILRNKLGLAIIYNEGFGLQWKFSFYKFYSGLQIPTDAVSNDKSENCHKNVANWDKYDCVDDISDVEVSHDECPRHAN